MKNGDIGGDNPNYNEIVFSDKWKKEKDDPEGFRKYREIWNRAPQDALELAFPVHLDIETTTYCNLACPFCPRTEMINKGVHKNPNQMMVWPDYKRIIDQGVSGGIHSIKLNYLGEPLLHPDVVDQVAYAKDQGVMDVILNSNCTPLTKKKARSLLEAGLDALFCSFDAANPRDYAKQRVGASMGQVIDNLYQFVELRNKIRPSCHVRVSMVMYPDPYWLDQFKALQTMWRDIVDAIGYGIYIQHTESSGGNELYPEVEGFRCAYPFHRMFLKMSGDVTVCCIDSINEMSMGNWRRQSLSEIWSGTSYQQFRGIHRKGEYYSIPMCRKCSIPMIKPKEIPV